LLRLGNCAVLVVVADVVDICEFEDAPLVVVTVVVALTPDFVDEGPVDVWFADVTVGGTKVAEPNVWATSWPRRRTSVVGRGLYIGGGRKEAAQGWAPLAVAVTCHYCN
jgi:hypothetical protein